MQKHNSNTKSCISHYPMLCTFLCNVYDAIKFDNAVSVIDKALAEGDVDTLIKISSESNQNNEKGSIGEIFSSRSESDVYKFKGSRSRS